MYKKIISVMSVALVVFLCSFPAFAVTSGGKTIVSNSYSYNNGDVTLYTRVNGHKNDEEYTGGDRIYTYQHSFTVTLANNTNEFQVASTNSFTVDLYTGYTDTFAATTTNTPSSTQMYRPSWGSEVTSYSNNMSAPRVLMYPSGDNAGHILISFEDSDLLVLNPNETREYNFTINFNMSYDGINQYPINGNAQYSYFTYSGSVSMYSRPSGFTENSIEDFINNDSVPNSVIAWVIAQYQQDNDAYNDILNSINQWLSNIALTGNSNQFMASGVNDLVNGSGPNISYSYFVCNPTLITGDFEIGNSGNYAQRNIYKVEIFTYYRLFNNTNNTYNIDGTLSVTHEFNFTLNNCVRNGFDYSVLISEGLYPYYTTHARSNFYMDDRAGTTRTLASGETRYVVEKYTYYFMANDTSVSQPSISVSVNIAPYGNITFTQNSQKWFSNIYKNFADIRDRIQSILDSYQANVPAAEDVTDNSDNASDTIDNQHQTEANYFEDSQSAINDTGIQNFQFDSNTLGGLGGIKDDFTAVWTSCGSLAQYWIASLTIGLALSIIRHRRMFSHD